jgi:hypothetical protein
MNISRADRLMSRLLFIKLSPIISTSTASADDEQQTRRAENALTVSLMFSGVRCILQYALLPFLLPIIGVAADATVPILLGINVIAVVSIFFSLRRFWAIQYKRRWEYLAVASFAMLLLVAFTAYDIINLQAA